VGIGPEPVVRVTGGTASTASLGPGETGLSIALLPSGLGWNRALDWAVSSGKRGIGSGGGTGLEGRGGAVGLRAQCCSSTAPASWRTPCASRDRRRPSGSRQRMDCGGLPPLCEAGQGETWPSHWGGSRLGNGILAPRVEAEVLSARAARGPLRTGNSGRAGWFSFGSPSSGGTIGVRNGGRKRWAGERGMQAARRIRVRSRGPASFGLGPWRKLCWVWRPSGYRALAPAVPAQPPRQGVHKQKCAVSDLTSHHKVG